MTDRAPGSFVEAKRFGLAWHYRLADPEFSAFLARELISLLEQQLAGTDLVVLAGRKVVEVRHAWATKGEAAWAIRARGSRPAFELAIGDDRTDEDLFGRLPATAWTIHVGRGPSLARYRVAGPEDVHGLLDAIAGATTTRTRPASLPRGRRPSVAIAAAGRARARRPARTAPPRPAVPRSRRAAD
jgi:trehalose 6-phosphate synthase/phosphatase